MMSDPKKEKELLDFLITPNFSVQHAWLYDFIFDSTAGGT